MGNKRAVFLYIDDKSLTFDFGTYALMMFYAKQVDSRIGKMLFDATLSEFQYRANYDLPIDNISGADNNAHFNIVELEKVIAFIENRLIPRLNNESQDLLEKYGGISNFYDLMYGENIGFLENISIDIDEFYDGDPEQMAYTLTMFNNFLKYAMSVNRAYSVSVH